MRKFCAALARCCKIPRIERKVSIGEFLTSLAISFVVLSLVSFSMLWVGDKINKKNLAVTRYMATSQAPLTGKFYDNSGQKLVTVLTYDQQFLRETGSSWPISYEQHGDWVLRIVEDENTRPKAIFLDVTFTQYRDDPSVSQLLAALCKAKNEFGVDIYLAALASPRDGELHIRKDLEQGVQDGCFKLVSVNYIPDPVDRMSWDYPMHSHVGENGWLAKLPTNDAPVLTSAALAIASGSAGLVDPNEDDSLALVWGVLNQQPAENKPDLFSYCRYGDMSMFRLIPGVIRGVFNGEDARPICPYNLTYSVAQLATLPEEQLSDALKDRFVFMGAVVPGQNDLIDSPVHGTIPGVFLHAMALDNLLTFGSTFKRSANWEFPPSIELFTAGLLSVFIVLMVHVLWGSFTHLLVSNRPQKNQVPFESLEVHQRLIRLVPEAMNWLARIAIQTAVSMLCVVWLQKYFAIGMLPVIELVGMTILAEMLGYANKVEQFLKPPEHINYAIDHSSQSQGDTE